MNREQPFGPRWLVERFEAEYQGVLYTGMGTLGYDPKKKKMVGTWIDSVTSNLMVVEGNMSEDGKYLSLDGLGPGRNGDLVRTLLHTTWHSAYKHEFRVTKRDPARGDWVHVMANPTRSSSRGSSTARRTSAPSRPWRAHRSALSRGAPRRMLRVRLDAVVGFGWSRLQL